MRSRDARFWGLYSTCNCTILTTTPKELVTSHEEGEKGKRAALIKLPSPDTSRRPAMGNSKRNFGSDGSAAMEFSIKLSVQVLTGTAALTMTYFMYRCMESCAALLQAMQHYH
jgi:hypothetical protein